MNLKTFFWLNLVPKALLTEVIVFSETTKFAFGWLQRGHETELPLSSTDKSGLSVAFALPNPAIFSIYGHVVAP
jgi:hypothetical protein